MSIDITNVDYSNVAQLAQQLNRAVAIKRIGAVIRLVVE